MHRIVTVTVASLLLAGCSVFGVRSGYEQPAYSAVEQIGETVEVRRYAPRIAAQASVDAADTEDGMNDAFMLLFDYISGENRADTSIAMTTPVETAQSPEQIAMTAPVETARTEDGETRMRFFLPAKYDAGSAPEPRNPRVSIVELPAETMAVLRFSGLRRDSTVATKKDELLAALEATPWRATAEPVALFYDPPWTLPFFRRNEVAVAVTR